MKKIFVINPGATSTKVAYYENTTEIFSYEITYSLEQLKPFNNIFDQLSLRLTDIESLIKEKIPNHKFDAVVGRGGLLPPVDAGAILVDENLIDCLKNRPLLEHASNLGASLARSVAEKFGVESAPSFIYDPVTVDQMNDVARISGSSLIDRKSVGHALNMRAVAHDVANKLNIPYESGNFIVVHVGGGSSASAHENGRMVDVISDDEVMFSSERTGGIPLKQYINLCYEKTKSEVTEDARKIHELMDNGDEKAKLVLEAMAYQISKAIGELATVLKGQVNAIILTGGIARSNFISDKVRERVEFIAPLFIIPGEKEMQALASGALRVLNNEEKYNIFEK